jgi:hypothetical protein
VLRWLFPVIAVLALVLPSAASWAAAGVHGEAECCCPIKAKCKCHDHDQAPQPASELRRCSGEAELVAPTVLAAVEPMIALVETELHVTEVREPAPPPLADHLPAPPEKPPF